MREEDKELLLQDLCARLPYGVHIFTNSKHHIRLLTISRDLDYDEQYWINGLYDIDEVKPYLRPMSSMTDEELVEFLGIRGMNLNSEGLKTFREGQASIVSTLPSYSRHVDWMNRHHFDYRGLIEKGLAIEVTEENNPYKQ